MQAPIKISTEELQAYIEGHNVTAWLFSSGKGLDKIDEKYYDLANNIVDVDVSEIMYIRDNGRVVLEGQISKDRRNDSTKTEMIETLINYLNNL